MRETTVITVTLNPAIDKTISLAGLQIGGLNRVVETQIDPGGKGINVAKALREFGIKVLATGFIAGEEGNKLIAQLKSEKITTSFVEIPGETRTNIKILDELTNTTTEINESGFTVGEDEQKKFITELNQKIDTLIQAKSKNDLADVNSTQQKYLVLGGSLPEGITADYYYELIRLANNKGIKVIFDADGVAFKEGIKAKPFAVKPNIFELEQLYASKFTSISDILQAGKKLVESGISLVIISMGKKGALVLNAHEAYYVKTYQITPKSAVGAGDSMVAALIKSLLENKTLEETAVWVTTAGTVTAGKKGSQVCTLTEVQNNLSKVQVEKLDL